MIRELLCPKERSFELHRHEQDQKVFTSFDLSDSASTRSTDDSRRYGSIDSIYRNNNESKLYSSVPDLKTEVLRIQNKLPDGDLLEAIGFERV